MAYDVHGIAKAALRLLDKVGLDGLTTRRLADALGIEGPALYHHFENKAELLGEMATVLLRESLDKTPDRSDWKRWLRDHAVANRLTMLRYRDSARIIAASSPTRAMKREIMPAVAKPLIDAGFTRIDAYEMVSLIAAFTLGFVIEEQNASLRSYISTVINIERGFLHGVEALIAGVEKKYSPRVKKKVTRMPLRAAAGRRRSES